MPYFRKEIAEKHKDLVKRINFMHIHLKDVVKRFGALEAVSHGVPGNPGR